MRCGTKFSLVMLFVCLYGAVASGQGRNSSSSGERQNESQEPTGTAAPHGQQLVIIDTDIGDDIDDAFAIGLALQSPEVKLLGITTAWGNTGLRGN